ncbi:hypothetical protein M0R04_09395 [Candidatus Dojkabacteria bacterium]|jgi:hypothetical protein|nr:hypothetical protein [Candidatus Dojkabacteria bacterium]
MTDIRTESFLIKADADGTISVYGLDGDRLFGMDLSVLDTLISTFLTEIKPYESLIRYLDHGVEFLESQGEYTC